MTDEHATELAELSAYVLGALPPAERDRARAHLAGCARCQDELRSLAPLPGLLGRLRPADTVASTGPPAALRGQVVDRVLRARSRARRRTLLAGAALAAVGLAGAAVLVGPGPGPDFRPMAVAAPAPGLRATAAVSRRSWGTAVEVRGSGWPDGEVYDLAVVADDGLRHRLGSWRGTGRGRLDCAGSTWIAREHLRAVQVQDADGTVVATLPLS